MTPTEYFIYNEDDELIREHLAKLDFKGTKVPFAIKQIDGTKAYFQDNSIVTDMHGIREVINVSESPLIGKHNQYNTLAAVLAALLSGVNGKQIEAALKTFKNAEHRLQKIGEADGVTYINDSKATNVEAVWFALEGIKKPIVWIAGGVDKGNNYETLIPLAKEKIKALICLGKENEKLFTAFQDSIPIIEESQSVEEVVKKAQALAVAGDVVLLSPACASFDLFNNYEHRGHQFMEAVRRIALEGVEGL